MPNSARSTRQFTISFPPDLAVQVEQLAEKENRNISELFREAFRTYREMRLRRAFSELRAIAEANAPEIKTEEDVVQLVKEIRAKRTRKTSSITFH